MSAHRWSLTSRTLWIAVGFSVLWHLFWFFSIHITVSPLKKSAKPRPRIVSLGPVLDDSIFRQLVDTRPEASQAFYRRITDLKPIAQIEDVKTTQRQPISGVISLPYSRDLAGDVKDLLSGTKQVPEHEFNTRFRIPLDQTAKPAEDDCAGQRLPSGTCVDSAADPMTVTAY